MIPNIKSYISRDSHPDLPLDPDAVQPGTFKWPPHLAPSLQAVVIIGGCFGTLARYVIALLVPSSHDSWPFATLAANLLGALILGVLLQTLFHLGHDEGKLKVIRLGIGTGFIGSFTSFSSLAVEVNLLHMNHHVELAISYAIVTIVGGLLTSALGIRLATHRHLAKNGVSS